MASASWPAALPQHVEVQGYAEELAPGYVETTMAAGPPRRDAKPHVGDSIDCVVWMDAAAWATFATFWRDTLRRGTLPFDWVHPVERTAAVFEVATAPKRTLLSGGMSRVALKLRVVG